MHVLLCYSAGMEWFAVQVLTGKEKEYRLFANSLVPVEQQAKLYIPTRRMVIRRRGTEIAEERPVYSGYIFLVSDTMSPEQAGLYRRVPGFVRWVGTDGRPQGIRTEDLEVLHHLLSHGEILGISRARYDENMRIQVIEGPLKGLEGRIVRVDKRKRRARVRLDLYNNSFEVDFGFELIEEREKDARNHD